MAQTTTDIAEQRPTEIAVKDAMLAGAIMHQMGLAQIVLTKHTLIDINPKARVVVDETDDGSVRVRFYPDG